MNSCPFDLAGERLSVLPSGALWWEGARVLCVSDLHLGKSERFARRTGTVLLPPYEVADTLSRLDADLAATRPETVICLGDSFDDAEAAAALPEDARLWLLRMQAGRRWVWIEGNHDPGRVAPGGTHRAELALGPLTFRHIAEPGAAGEISGHYHPKATITGRAGRVTRPCVLHDASRAILPAYGTYTGGLRWTDPVFHRLFGADARAILLARTPVAVAAPYTASGGVDA